MFIEVIDSPVIDNYLDKNNLTATNAKNS